MTDGVVLQALEAIAEQITEKLDIAAYAFMPPSIPTVPAVVLLVDDVDYSTTLKRNCSHQLNVTLYLFVSRSDENEGQTRLLQFLDPSAGLKSAIDTDTTANGKVSDMRLQTLDLVDYGQVAQSEYLIGVFTLEVHL